MQEDSMSTPIVYLIDDDTLSRETLAALLSVDGFRVAAYATGEDFLASFQDDPAVPRCLVCDLRLPGIDGLALQARLKESGIRMPIVFISGYANVPAAVRAMKLGAVDFLEKPFERTKLVECINQALERDRAACEHLASRIDVGQRLAKLTPREREVLDLLVAAQSTKEIASRLGINAKTVFVHRARVMEKMGVDSLVELSHLVRDGERAVEYR